MLLSHFLFFFLVLSSCRDDLLRAIRKLKTLGNGFTIHPIGKTFLIQSVPGELTMDHTTVLQQAQVTGSFIDLVPVKYLLFLQQASSLNMIGTINIPLFEICTLTSFCHPHTVIANTYVLTMLFSCKLTHNVLFFDYCSLQLILTLSYERDC